MLSRDLASQLNTAIQFLVECRPLSVSMGNAIKFLKLQVGLPDPSLRDKMLIMAHAPKDSPCDARCEQWREMVCDIAVSAFSRTSMTKQHHMVKPDGDESKPWRLL